MDAKRDENKVVTMLGVSSADGVTPIPVQIDSVTGRVLLNLSASGVHGAVSQNNLAKRDGNRKTTMMGTSSDDDGTLVPVVVEGANLRVKAA